MLIPPTLFLMIKIVFSNFVKKKMGIWRKGIGFNLWIGFHRMVIIRKWISSIHKHVKPFHFLLSSSVTFFRCYRYHLEVFHLSCWVSWQIFYFLWDSWEWECVHDILLPVQLLVHKKALDLSMLYPAILLTLSFLGVLLNSFAIPCI